MRQADNRRPCRRAPSTGTPVSLPGQPQDKAAAFDKRVFGGPIGTGEQTLHVVEARDESDITARLARDPWASAGLLRIGTIEPWALWLDGRPKSYP